MWCCSWCRWPLQSIPASLRTSIQSGWSSLLSLERSEVEYSVMVQLGSGSTELVLAWDRARCHRIGSGKVVFYIKEKNISCRTLWNMTDVLHIHTTSGINCALQTQCINVRRYWANQSGSPADTVRGPVDDIMMILAVLKMCHLSTRMKVLCSC